MVAEREAKVAVGGIAQGALAESQERANPLATGVTMVVTIVMMTCSDSWMRLRIISNFEGMSVVE